MTIEDARLKQLIAEYAEVCARWEGVYPHAAGLYGEVRDALTELLRLRQEGRTLREHVALAEHKIDQHLQGQYPMQPYAALGVALMELRKALLLLPAAPEGGPK